MRTALSIAGSDPTGGAGTQGDLRAFAALGVHGLSVVTCITAQGTRGVRRVEPLEPRLVAAQLDALLQDVRPDAIKTGALATAGIVRVVAQRIARSRAPLVVDPVLRSTSGATLLSPRAIALFLRALVAGAAVVTPNVDELAMLLGRAAPRDVRALREAAVALRAQTGAKAVLAKGGHLEGDSIDVLVDGRGTAIFTAKRVQSECTHGTGCVLASAIAAGLARGRSLRSAVRDAKSLVTEAMQRARPIGPGKSPLDLTRCSSARDFTSRTSAASSERARSRP